MAEHHTGPAEVGAPMDYKEHEKTYNLFISGAKVGSAIVAALLIAMAAGFFGHAGPHLVLGGAEAGGKCDERDGDEQAHDQQLYKRIVAPLVQQCGVPVIVEIFL